MLEAMFFESWLRYHFLEDTPEREVCLRITESAWKKIKAETPHLETLAQELDQKPVTIDNSRAALLNFLRHWCKQEDLREMDCMGIVLDSDFQIELENQQNWISLHQLSLPPLDFNEWQNLYGTWKTNNKLARGETGPDKKK